LVGSIFYNDIFQEESSTFLIHMACSRLSVWKLCSILNTAPSMVNLQNNCCFVEES
jgi:hypothetical protein